MADPGFPQAGAANPWAGWGGSQHTIFLKFPKNCMKLKEFGLGGGAKGPLRSTTGKITPANYASRFVLYKSVNRRIIIDIGVFPKCFH